MAATKQMRQNAQALRKNMTKEERHLWYDFLKTYPVQIRRQHIIQNYIVDFYCYQAQLVIELDGNQHCTPEGLEYDRRRTALLESQGLKVMRISNLDVMRRFRSVCEGIDLEIQKRLPLGEAGSRRLTDEGNQPPESAKQKPFCKP